MLVPDFDFGIEYTGATLFTDTAPKRTFISDTSRQRDFAERLPRACPTLIGTAIFAQEDAYESIHRPTIGDAESFEPLCLGTVAGVLGPESGEWVIVVNDEWQAIVAARSEVHRIEFERAFGDRREVAVDFIDYWHGFKDDMRTDWIVPLLFHVLPSEDVDPILAGPGQWLLLDS
jgi:hypothetical protein